ncbi:ABC transporter permease [Rhodococcus antarcticus]|uniref:ABC transporter permease n=1 Tax=Rhodococcus antarcticus TaxID=2987751 RepID=A0ABY6P312_9NOCA|nr:ABC transporter permease subunit [Rhodococcus antarcticus]UZJ25523.1 ABC transporter permease [Rhodococcus antarcticus]
MIGVVAAQQVTVLRRQRTAAVVVSVLVGITVLAGVIGWSSAATITRVYDQAVLLLASQGRPAPPNPLGLKPPLSLLSNMTVYVPMVGALLAIVVGHLSLSDEQSSGSARLLHSRPLTRRAYLLGKLVAVSGLLAVALVASLVVAVVSLVVVNATFPSPSQLLRLVGFYGLSLLYLVIFALVAMVAVLLTRRRSMALLSALGAWLVVTFVVPQFISGLRPTASLNPLSVPVGTSQTFFDITSRVRFLSLSEVFKNASAQILATAPGEPLIVTLGRVVPLAVAALALVAAALVLVRRHDYSRSAADE